MSKKAKTNSLSPGSQTTGPEVKGEPDTRDPEPTTTQASTDTKVEKTPTDEDEPTQRVAKEEDVDTEIPSTPHAEQPRKTTRANARDQVRVRHRLPHEPTLHRG